MLWAFADGLDIIKDPLQTHSKEKPQTTQIQIKKMDKCPAATEPTQRKENLYAILLLGVVNRPKHSDESPQRCFIFAESSVCCGHLMF